MHLKVKSHVRMCTSHTHVLDESEISTYQKGSDTVSVGVGHTSVNMVQLIVTVSGHTLFTPRVMCPQHLEGNF